MNKLVKGSIAGAAGIALLLGGAGTFALWNSSATVNAGSLATGQMSIVANAAAGEWKDVSTLADGTTPSLIGGTTFTPASHKLVPGDTVTYTKSVSITATGKNMKARLAYTPSSIVVDPALSTYVTVSIAPANLTGGGTFAADGSTGAYFITPGATGSTTLDVVITVKFSDTPTGVVGQNITNGVNLTGAAFTLTQVRP